MLFTLCHGAANTVCTCSRQAILPLEQVCHWASYNWSETKNLIHLLEAGKSVQNQVFSVVYKCSCPWDKQNSRLCSYPDYVQRFMVLIADALFHSDASTVVWPQTTQGHGQQQPSLSVVTTVWGVTSSMTNGTANMTHDPTNPGIPTTNTVNSVGHPYLSTSANPANPKQYGAQGKLNVFFL